MITCSFPGCQARASHAYEIIPSEVSVVCDGHQKRLWAGLIKVVDGVLADNQPDRVWRTCAHIHNHKPDLYTKPFYLNYPLAEAAEGHHLHGRADIIYICDMRLLGPGDVKINIDFLSTEQEGYQIETGGDRRRITTPARCEYTPAEGPVMAVTISEYRNERSDGSREHSFSMSYHVLGHRGGQGLHWAINKIDFDHLLGVLSCEMPPDTTHNPYDGGVAVAGFKSINKIEVGPTNV